MLFNSLQFILFLPVVVLLYYLLLPKHRWMLIFIASCYFYMSFVPAYILILFAIILIDYTAAIAIENAHPKKKRLYLIMSLCANLALLTFFKYFNFTFENLTWLLKLTGANVNPYHLDIILPIGLSFHTLQSMGYTIEVYRGNQKAERHFGYFSNYVLFFPQMVAGPIERYAGLGAELRKEHTATYANFADGLRLILFGLLIKMSVADNIAPYVNQVYDKPMAHSAAEVMLAVVLFAFQIYADFYGYSTIALGSARLLGLGIMNNFQTPFSSASVTEFWRRWHISLSTWFNDYVFTPFVTNGRKWGKWAVVTGLLLTFFLSGLWHGAGWNFALYGLMHGAALAIEFLTKKQRKKLSGMLPKKLFSRLGTVATFLYVAFSWIFFRSENFSKSREVLYALFTSRLADVDYSALWIALAAASVMIGFDIFLYGSRIDTKLKNAHPTLRWAAYSVMLFCLLALSGTQKFNFIYFQF